MPTSTDAIRQAAALLASVRVGAITRDSELLELTHEVERAGRFVDALRSAAAAEISRRSDRELGRAGLAARQGYRTPSALIASITHVSGRQADSRARLGRLVEPLAGLASALSEGSIGTDAAESIALAMAPVLAHVPAEHVDREVAGLVAFAESSPADEVARAARTARDRLDAEGVEQRESDLRARRYVRFGRPIEGMTPMHALLPPEEAAVARALFDARTSSRRQPRFSENPDEGLVLDDRTMDKRRADVFADICRIAAGQLPGDALMAGAGTVVVTMTLEQLEERIGAVRIDGSDESISAESARRIACNAGILPYVLGAKGQPLDLGYTRRLFSPAQKLVLLQQSGCCEVDGCDAPPGWLEAHHIVPWSRGGPTDLANGIMLCSFDHHLVHEGLLEVTVTDGVARVVRAVGSAAEGAGASRGGEEAHAHAAAGG